MSAEYYKKYKERFHKKAHGRYQDLSEEEKSKKRQHACKQYKKRKTKRYGREQYKNLLEDEKKD